MAINFRSGKASRLFQPGSSRPFTVSRSKIDLFLECPRCFYLDRRLGVSRPPGFPFNLNSAVDTLLKKEFDFYRANQKIHPLMQEFSIEAIPFKHENLDMWRNNFKGIRHQHTPSNLEVMGAVDDVWVNPKGELIVVDYKATSKQSAVNIDAPWQIAYKRQMEVYQWLLRQNGFTVSETGYFLYCNGKTDRNDFQNHLEFAISILPYKGSAGWIENALHQIQACLKSEQPPAAGEDCAYCGYREAASSALPPTGGTGVQGELL